MNDIALIQGRLEDYRCTSSEEEMNAVREILQELILAGLARTDFFVKAAFHGGTQLRIFEGVRRFSEDLDFALVSQEPSFQLLPYLEKVAEELSAIGVAMEVRERFGRFKYTQEDQIDEEYDKISDELTKEIASVIGKEDR